MPSELGGRPGGGGWGGGWGGGGGYPELWRDWELERAGVVLLAWKRLKEAAAGRHGAKCPNNFFLKMWCEIDRRWEIDRQTDRQTKTGYGV